MSDMLPRPEPREPFKRALRSQLLTQAATVLVPRETVWTRFQQSLLRPALAFAAVILVLVAGAGKAAADSLSGDAAFGLKTAAEQLQLALAFDDTTRLALLSDEADHRLVELARAITTRPASTPVATDAYAAAVARFTAAVDALRGKPDTSEAKRALARDVVDAAHLRHAAVLRELRRNAPAGAEDGLERATREADKLHASDQPARTPEPSDSPDRTDPTRSPLPSRTAAPVRTTDPARANETPRSEPTRTTPRPSPTAIPTRTG